jgi:hypothetical protein
MQNQETFAGLPVHSQAYEGPFEDLVRVTAPEERVQVDRWTPPHATPLEHKDWPHKLPVDADERAVILVRVMDVMGYRTRIFRNEAGWGVKIRYRDCFGDVDFVIGTGATPLDAVMKNMGEVANDARSKEIFYLGRAAVISELYGDSSAEMQAAERAIEARRDFGWLLTAAIEMAKPKPGT